MSGPSPAERLKQALTTLASGTSRAGERLTLSALCEAAHVSRNSVYRYHPEVLRALRAHQRQVDRAASGRLLRAVFPEKPELVRLRSQTAKLVALIDHYYAAYREAQTLLTRREKELTELRRRLDSKPVRITG